MRTHFLTLPMLLLLLALPAVAQDGKAQSACVSCHSSGDFFEGEALEIADHVADGVHGQAGLSCHDCHGGNPDPQFAEDLDGAKDESFVGAPSVQDMPAFCGKCHSYPEYMRRFDPAARVDQEREYWTSRHGQAVQEGNDKAATCTSCHGVHGILHPDDASSPVYPTNVAETCGTCHSDASIMANLPGGRSLPTDQHARWKESVHAKTMHDRGDLTAPTCNDCHGNHGAIPPGVDSVSYICGQCHGREAEIFRKSPKHVAFEEHNEFIESSESCADCHEEEPQKSLTGVKSFAECTTCHGNHGVVRPTVAMLAPLPESPCALCHEATEPLIDDVPEIESVMQNYEQTRNQLLESGKASGVEGDELFNWLVDAALSLPNHTFEGEEGLELRPEFARLFDKFRIGKTYYTYENPNGEGTLRGEIVRCTTCHSAEPIVADEPIGLNMAGDMITHMQQLTTRTARSERVMLAARRGGVEVREALNDIDVAVDAQIGLEVLVHTFDAGEESDFKEKYNEGLEAAQKALKAGEHALTELDYRRKGLAIALVFIFLVAVGLVLKIREIS